MKYGLFGSFVATDSKRDELLAILIKASELLKQNEGCIHYLLSTSDEPNIVYVYETWTDKEAHDKSLEPEEIKSLIKQAMPLIKSMGESTELLVKGGKGF